ncbi:hypothetical protein A4E84_32350 [Streptomyces qaidamensis]|uniref:Tyr recombinase domain-containing protein n=1 Tax=Streptomyces qaidamensis TaxID=1783515 RepID=A0A143C8N8_9ACTN|nr:tyrosine-type recombinase/integrase [Streptomyces qaidamensis]AMW13788.1 hypothetical protein A4E84_32350 [Streptomyces qaidamensis]
MHAKSVRWPKASQERREAWPLEMALRVRDVILTTRFGNAIAVNTWNTYTWKPALAKAGIIPPRAKGAKDWQWEAAPKDGFHVLRHTYASIMLEAGESVVTVARWLGHSSPAITLGYYAHFMPEAGSKGRTAIDGLLRRRGDLHAGRNSPDSPQGCRRPVPTVQHLREWPWIARLMRRVT